MYRIDFTKTARREVSQFEQSDPRVFKKIEKLLLELSVHPYTGRGKPELLRRNRTGQWSRRINHKHRLIYEVSEETVTVLILSSYGHYDDK